MPTCEVAVRCTDPRAQMVRCEFYEDSEPGMSWLGVRRCKHIRTVEPICTHPVARRMALADLLDDLRVADEQPGVEEGRVIMEMAYRVLAEFEVRWPEAGEPVVLAVRTWEGKS